MYVSLYDILLDLLKVVKSLYKIHLAFFKELCGYKSNWQVNDSFNYLGIKIQPTILKTIRQFWR